MSAYALVGVGRRDGVALVSSFFVFTSKRTIRAASIEMFYEKLKIKIQSAKLWKSAGL